MNFRIKSIFLIPKNEEKDIRKIEFSLDKVNVITGGSEKGKSALIAIVDYCLGSEKCRIPTRKIRNYTEWFGIHVLLDNEVEVIIARKEPGDFMASGEMYLKEGYKLMISKEIIANCNVSDVKRRLDAIAGLTDLNFAEDASKAGFDSRPSFRDFTSFLFQPQYIIANQASLFYRTDSMAHRQKLISIFNYVLQAVDNDYLELKEELKSIERRIYELNREVEKKRRSVNRLLGELRGYFVQAKEFGLLVNEVEPAGENNTSEYLKVLKKIPLEVSGGDFTSTPLNAVTNTSQRISVLTAQELKFAYELQNLKHRQELIDRLVDGNDTYRNDLLKQHGRLKTSEWFSKLLSEHEQKCPFCLTATNSGKEYVSALISTNNKIISQGRQLNDNITVLKSEQRKIKGIISEVIQRINEVRQELAFLRKSSQDDNRQLNTINSIYRFSGKVETELKNYEIFTGDNSAELEIIELERRRTAISKKVNQEVILNKIKRAKKKITDIISYYAEIFKAENYNELIQFNEKDLTLTFVSENGRTDALYEIGSGSNFMAYHISTILAFHEFFLTQVDHPSPNFIFLDQPTQVYFPEKNDTEGDDKSEDRVRVERIFIALDNAITRTKGKLQIIILEHVGEYAWEGLQNVIKIKRWRDDEADKDDRALIPNSWFEG
ncbi:DUF3732 domain-containing protein [Pedobacter aquatilis]|uniref:DUF3732 domain-containing protein n=1 Tax=Pedobacter aquatilis TaxID=351343 RepID=UPI0025B5F222|nr:DUF3732 domain-containing protein [Pedobacter aquatilis]MDN3588073.1 DUF3732 domain-containing protein [Pedobacter aquatilis]